MEKIIKITDYILKVLKKKRAGTKKEITGYINEILPEGVEPFQVDQIRRRLSDLCKEGLVYRTMLEKLDPETGKMEDIFKIK